MSTVAAKQTATAVLRVTWDTLIDDRDDGADLLDAWLRDLDEEGLRIAVHYLATACVALGEQLPSFDRDEFLRNVGLTAALGPDATW